MTAHVDPFIGTDVTDLPAPLGAGGDAGGGPSRRSATPTPAPTSPLGMVSACAYSGAYPTGYGRYDLSHRGRADRAVRPSGRVRVHALPAVRHRRDPQVLQLLPRHADAAAARRPRPAVGAPRRGRGARLLRGDARLRHPLRDHRRAQERRPPLHVPAAPRTPGSSSTSRSAAWRSRTAGPSRCGPTCTPSARASPRARSSSRARRSPSTSSATPRSGVSCSGTTGASCPAAPGSTSTTSARRRCARSASCGPGRRSPARPSSCASASPCAASTRPARTCARDCGDGPSSFAVRRARDDRGLGRAPRRDRGRDAVGRAQDGVRHRAVPLADQAVPRPGREPVLAAPTARSRSTSRRCGTSTARSCRCSRPCSRTGPSSSRRRS